MTSASVTKTINKLNNDSDDYSLGFKRMSALPTRVRKAFDIATYLRLGHINFFNEQVSFFEEMTEVEYINYLRLA